MTSVRPLTLDRHIVDATRRLRAAGIPADEAALDARLLAQRVLGWEAATLLASGTDPAPEGFAPEYEPLVARRAAREPLAYVTGAQEFWGLSFEVAPAVLIPRPETELLVEIASGVASRSHRLRVADICTGSGCVAVALARERPTWTVVATDVSSDALLIARRNAVRHDTAGRVRLVRADLLAGVRGPFDVIVANPPYVAEQDRQTLQPEVRDYEPPAALFAGPDGLAVIRRLLPEGRRALGPGGVLAVEFGFGQEDAIEQLVAGDPGARLAGIRRDLQGIPRVALVTSV